MAWAKPLQRELLEPVAQIEQRYSILPVQLPPSEASRPLPQTQPPRFSIDVNVAGGPRMVSVTVVLTLP